MCTVVSFCDPLNFYKRESESEYCAWMNVSWMFSIDCLAISLPIIQLEPERPFPLAVSSKAWALITCVSGQGGRTRRSTNVGCRRAENLVPGLDLYSGCKVCSFDKNWYSLKKKVSISPLLQKSYFTLGQKRLTCKRDNVAPRHRWS